MIKIKIKNRDIEKFEPLTIKPAKLDLYKEVRRFIHLKSKEK
ncbi:hypothetical protein [Clostridium sp. SHJSY1]|nr:hypothetical protein [Clostridium sp. SHJSY1]